MAQIIQARMNSEAEAREWELRCDMAAVFRVQARHGWNEQIGNHNSLMLPGDRPDAEPTFLINPRGYLFQELRASDLIVCTLDGRVVRGKGELRKVAFHIHARIHLKHPSAACVVHIHPQYLTALSMIEGGEFVLSHHNTLMLADRTMYDPLGHEPVDDNAEGDRIAEALGDKTVMVMRGHGVTVVGPTVEDAFDECFIAERTAMYQITAMQTGRKLHVLPPSAKRSHTGRWGDRVDARLHLDAWRRLLDKEGSDYAS
jgi:ribulose-5-phosphate 4-epimerase/fuculose-1-phosphate aldolase